MLIRSFSNLGPLPLSPIPDDDEQSRAQEDEASNRQLPYDDTNEGCNEEEYREEDHQQSRVPPIVRIVRHVSTSSHRQAPRLSHLPGRRGSALVAPEALVPSPFLPIGILPVS